MKHPCRDQLLEELRAKIQRLEQSRNSTSRAKVFSTGLPELDQLLPDQGLTCRRAHRMATARY